MRRLLSTGACALVLLVAGCDAKAAELADPAPATYSSASSSAPAPPSGPLTVVGVGASVTDADSADFPAGVFGPGSWVSTADRDGIDVTGGWAIKGATTAAMAAGAQPSDADVLVVMAGTNDVLQGIPWEQSAANIEAIVGAVGVDRVVLCTIVPLASNPAGETDFNAHLAALADEHGWRLVDSAAAVRAPDGQWLAGLSEDGIHPADAAAALLGTAIHDALLS